MKDLTLYPEALELKELGFDEPCLGYYDTDGLKISSDWYLNPQNKNSLFPEPHTTNNPKISAPTYSQAFRFFREKYDIHYSINRECSQHDHKWGYNWSLYNYTGIFDEFLTSHPDAPAGEWVYETYEEAERECLKEIIKIINEKD